MPQISAGILLFKLDPDLKFYLAHPGGPYWKNKDEGAWSIPKGVIEEEEEKLPAALREFEEEIGFKPEGNFIALGSVKQKGGKVVYAWAVESSLPDVYQIRSNSFEIEWPPNTGNRQQFPEVDRAEFFEVDQALKKINSAQKAFIERLQDELH